MPWENNSKNVPVALASKILKDEFSLPSPVAQYENANQGKEKEKERGNNYNNNIAKSKIVNEVRIIDNDDQYEFDHEI